MKTLTYILMICFMSFSAFAADVYMPVMYNTNTGQFAYGATNGVSTNMNFSSLNVSNLTATRISSQVITNTGHIQAAYYSATNSVCEADFKDGGSQSFTSGGAYQLITNWQINICDPVYTTTHSNATLSVSGRYRAYMAVQYGAGGASTVYCHMYTNGATAITLSGNIVGWDNSTTAVAQESTSAFEKLIYMTAGTVVDWRIEVVANETLTWGHGTVGLELK